MIAPMDAINGNPAVSWTADNVIMVAMVPGLAANMINFESVGESVFSSWGGGGVEDPKSQVGYNNISNNLENIH